MTNNFKKEYDGSLDSKYYFSSAKRIGATTSPQSPNQIGELTSRLNQGLKAVELGAMNQRLLDQVPKEHFNEIRRLNKLTGAEASLHAPIQDLDLAGFTQQGWDEFERKATVNKLSSALSRAHQMDPEGNTPVTVHAGGTFAQRWQKEGLKTEEGEPIKDARSEMVMVNQDSGQVQLAKYKEKEYFGGRKVIWTPELTKDTLNRNEWDREKLQIMQWKKGMFEVQDRTQEHLAKINYPELKYAEQQEEKLNKKILTEKERQQLRSMEKEIKYNEDFVEESYHNMRSLMEDMHNRFEKYSVKEGNEGLEYRKFKKIIEPDMKKEFEQGKKGIDKAKKEYIEVIRQVDKIKSKELSEELKEKLQKKQKIYMDSYTQQTESISKYMAKMPEPETWTSVEEFSKKKVSDSVSEAALNSWKKYGEKSPLISLENIYPEMALSRADALKETVEKAREKLADLLVKKEKLSQKKAEQTAEKLIGVTWDVGHIYMLKKYGYSDEDIQEEAKKIAPYVKHAHLTDNFGFEDSHLPPGLGEVNIKEQLKELEKAGFKGRQIVEAGEFVANFKETPHLYALSNLNSPLYAEKTSPYWQQIWDTYGAYSSGFGEMMPQKYFDLYGAPGFAQLPTAFGGSARAPERGRLATGEEES